MSCNCSRNPCSCASANCSCPPDYTVNPATLSCTGTTCEETLQTSCIFTDTYLACTAMPANSPLDDVLQAMDAKICECGSCSGNTHISPNIDGMTSYWVDSSNIVPGDGSVTNPFWSLELAYDKIVGSGTTASPDNPNVLVHVLPGVEYTTSLNIYIPGIKWNFYPTTVVNFTGTGYFIDSSILSTSQPDFYCLGWIFFKTSTGGFLKNTGNVVIAEAYRIYGNTAGLSSPLIYSTELYSIDAYTSIKLQSYQSLIISGSQHIIGHYGGALTVNLQTGFMIYGLNPFNGQSAGSTAGNILNCNNINTLASQHTLLEIQNGNFWSIAATNMISFSGVLVNFVLDNIKSCITGPGLGTLPTTFLNIGNVSISGVINYHRMLLKEVYLDNQCFASNSPNVVIVYSGGQQFFDYLQMQDCVLYSPLTISSTIRLGRSVYSSATVATKNVISGNLRFTNLPTSSSGLSTGELWNNSGVIQIV